MENTVSGGADLFYDAAGIDIVPPSNDTVDHSVFNAATSKRVPGKLASAFTDAGSHANNLSSNAAWKPRV